MRLGFSLVTGRQRKTGRSGKDCDENQGEAGEGGDETGETEGEVVRVAQAAARRS